MIDDCEYCQGTSPPASQPGQRWDISPPGVYIFHILDGLDPFAFVNTFAVFTRLYMLHMLVNWEIS